MKIFGKILLGALGILYLPRFLAGLIGGIMRWTMVFIFATFTYAVHPSIEWAFIGVVSGIIAPSVFRVFVLFS